MKKILSLILATFMVFSLCSCTKDPQNSSSESVEVEVEQIIVDQTGSTITESSDETTSENNSSVDKPIEENNNDVNNNSSSNNVSTNSSKFSVIDKYKNLVVEVDLCDDIVRGYLDAKDTRNQYYWLSTYSGTKYDYQKLYLDWYSDGSLEYTVHFSESANFSNEFIIKTKYNTIENATLVPGKTYYYKVTGTINSDVLGSGQIKVKDAPVRWIDIDGVGNVRDMGGWKAEGGKTVKYGMLYRGKALGSFDRKKQQQPTIFVTDEGLATIKQLGFKTELDVRYDYQKFETPNTGMNYEFIEHPGQYDNVMTNKPEVFKASYRRVFELLADKSNYPFYAHCNAGADRTGTFAFIVNGVLGVSYEDLTRDFELTSFSSSGKRWRGKGLGGDFGADDDVMQEDSSNTVAWGRLYKKMMEYGSQNGCTTLQESIEHWLLNYIGVKQSQIDNFKSIVLE